MQNPVTAPLPCVHFGYGCLFCKTGCEALVAQRMEFSYEAITATPVTILKRRSKQGVKTLQPEILLPGYVFFKAPLTFYPRLKLPDDSIKLLKSQDGEWQLFGFDRKFASWVIEQNGEIGLSKAYKIGERITIQQGPLKDLEGYITKIDKRNKSGQVVLVINGREIRVWLGFELLNDTKNMLLTASL